MAPAMTLEGLRRDITANDALVVYFRRPGCGICEALRPKVEALLAAEFPRIALRVVDADESPDAAGQLGVLTAPTLIAFFEGRETARLGRAFGLDELRGALERPYTTMFGVPPGA